MPAPSPRQAVAARVAYVGVLAVATLSNLSPEADVGAAMQRLEEALETGYSARAVVDAVRNLALFAGWGALWMATGRIGRDRAEIAGATVTGVALSLAIETLQLFSPVRDPSIVDVVTNTGGAFAGAVMIAFMVEVVSRMRRWKSYIGVPAITFAGSYIAAAAMHAAVAARSTPLPGVYGGPGQRFWETLGQFDAATIGHLPLWDFVMFAPLGVVLVAALVEFHVPRRRAAMLTAGWGAAASVGLELARGFIALPISAGAAVIHAAGIGAGAAIGYRLLPRFSQSLRGRRRPLAVGAGYALLLVVWSWRPFWPDLDLDNILAQLSLTQLIPLHAHATRVDFFSVADIGIGFFLFLPVGALLAVWPLRTTGVWSRAWPGVYLALATEIGQIVIVDRYFGGTDIIVQAAAVWIGWSIVRRAGFSVHGQLLLRPSGAEARVGGRRSARR